MNSIADRYLKKAPYDVHGWTWPMFVLILNLITLDSLLSLTMVSDKNMKYLLGSYIILAIFNFFVFTYKKRHTAIIDECSRLPFRIRRFGVVFFATYSIVSIIVLFVVIFGDLHVSF